MAVVQTPRDAMFVAGPMKNDGPSRMPWVERARAGLIGGLAGGGFNAVVMRLAGAWERIADRFEAPSPAAAFIVHMAFGGLTGVLYGSVFRNRSRSVRMEIARAVCFSVTLYLLIASTVMTLRFGAPQLGADGFGQLTRVLAGHVLFGVILGAVCRQWSRSP